MFSSLSSLSRLANGKAIDREQQQTKKSSAEGLSVLEALLLPVAELTSDQAVRQCLRKVADTLLNRLVLVINEQPYRLLEIEFYVTMKSHPDPYTHCAEGLQVFSSSSSLFSLAAPHFRKKKNKRVTASGTFIDLRP